MFLDRTTYFNSVKYVNLSRIKDYQPQLYELYACLLEWFNKHPEGNPSLSDLEVWFWATHSQSPQKEIYVDLFKTLSETNVSDATLNSVLQALIRKQNLQELAMAALDAVDEGAPLDRVTDLSKAVLEPSGGISEQEVQFVTDDLRVLFKQQVQDQGLRWPCPFLNLSLGSLRKGDFGFAFARPETGKTTFLSWIATCFAEQNKGDILWFNNEEQGNKVKIRMYQSSLGITQKDLWADIEGNMQAFMEKTGGRIKLLDQAIIHRSDVEAITDSLENVGCIIFDQIDKIVGFENDREDLKLGAIYQWARELAKRVAPVIGVCQADGSGEGIQYLTMANVANAKTAKQAEADWILGIGKSNDPSIIQNQRYFNISKNKLIGDTDSDPTYRHGKCALLIDPERGRYIDTGTYHA